MGTGKTLAVLALILARQMPRAASSSSVAPPAVPPAALSLNESAAPAVVLDDFAETQTMCICGLPVNLGNRKRACRVVSCSVCDRAQHELCVAGGGGAGAAFVCLRCTEDQLRTGTLPLVDTEATIVIVPALILAQWESEIAAHVAAAAAFRVVVYPGVRAVTAMLASAVKAWLRSGRTDAAEGAMRGARLLAASAYVGVHVVLLSYEVASADLHHALPGRGASGDVRYARYPRVPCPLVRLRWWRAVCDEAQMCGNPAAACSMLATELPAVHHWCVTGTPLTKSMSDCLGFWKFLGAGPFDVPGLWRAAVEGGLRRDPATRARVLRSVFRRLVWRTNKSDVADEMGIPPLHEEQVLLSFSPIEREYYSRMLQDVATELARATVSWGHDELSPLSADDAARVSSVLFRVRQVCCHPQAAASERTAVGAAGQILTLRELLERMKNDSRLGAEAAARTVAVALNGVGGVALCAGDLATAAGAYHRVLSLQQDTGVRVDAVLLVHAISGLLAGMESPDAPGGDAAAAAAPAVGPGKAMEIARLRRKAAEIAQKFLETAAHGVMTAVVACLAAAAGLKESVACRGGGSGASLQSAIELPLGSAEDMELHLSPLASGVQERLGAAEERGAAACAALCEAAYVAIRAQAPGAGGGAVLTVLSEVQAMELARRAAYREIRVVLSPRDASGGRARGCKVCRKVIEDSGGDASVRASSSGGSARCDVCAAHAAITAFTECFVV